MTKGTCTRYTFFSALFFVSIVGYFLYDNALLNFLFKRKSLDSGLARETNPLYTESRRKSIDFLEQVDLTQKGTKTLLQSIVDYFLPFSSSLSFTQLFEEVSFSLQNIKAINPSVLYELDIDDLRFVKSKHSDDKDVDEVLLSIMGMPQMDSCHFFPKSCLSIEKIDTIVRYTLDQVTALVKYIQMNPPSQYCDVQLMLLVLYIIITVKLQEIFQVNMSQLEASINRLRPSLEKHSVFNEMSFQFQRVLFQFIELTSLQFRKPENLNI